MKILFLFVISLYFIGCSSTPVMKDNISVWKAKKGDVELTILGTVHLNMGELPESLKREIERNDLVYAEVAYWKDIRMDKKSKKLLKDEMKKLAIADPVKVSMDLSPRGWSELLKTSNHPEFLKYTGLKKDEMRNFNSKYASRIVKSYMNKSVSHQALSLYVNNNLDTRFFKYWKRYKDTAWKLKKIKTPVFDRRIVRYAKEKKIKSISLDDKNVRFLIKNEEIKDKSTLKEEVVYLENIFGEQKYKEQIKKQLEELEFLKTLASKYNSGDLKGARAFVDSKAKNSSHQILKMKKRNILWTKKLNGIQGKKKVFVAGGLAHFLGRDNVLDMLKAKGFSVTFTSLDKSI